MKKQTGSYHLLANVYSINTVWFPALHILMELHCPRFRRPSYIFKDTLGSWIVALETSVNTNSVCTKLKWHVNGTKLPSQSFHSSNTWIKCIPEESRKAKITLKKKYCYFCSVYRAYVDKTFASLRTWAFTSVGFTRGIISNIWWELKQEQLEMNELTWKREWRVPITSVLAF